MTTENIPLIQSGYDRETIVKLAAATAVQCISIYLPTHRGGDEVLRRQDAKTLLAELKGLRKAWHGISPDEEYIDRRLQPLMQLAAHDDFWRNQSQGLALFATEDQLRSYKLPISVPLSVQVADNYNLVPMVPLFTGGDSFYLLSLELGRVRLFEGARESFRELAITDLIPEGLEDRVGSDFEEKGLQFRNQSQPNAGVTYHGHDEADRDRKDEIARYFRGIDEGIRTLLQRKPRPLLLATQPYLAALYAQVSTYGLIQDVPLVCNLSQTSDAALHAMAWKVIGPMNQKEGNDAWERFLQVHGTGKASTQPDRILAAAAAGRVDRLFIDPGADLRGRFDPGTGTLEIEEIPSAFTPSLVNRAVCDTLNNRGLVYARNAEDFPEDARGMAASFRY